MTINKKIIGLILISFLFVSSIFIVNSINALRKSQTDNLNLFKEEFLELARESFENNSYIFFYNLDAEINTADKRGDVAQTILNFIKRSDPAGESVIVVDMVDKKFIPGHNSSNLVSILDAASMESLIDKYIQENTLNQKTEFDLDNFSQFSSDKSSIVVPKKIHFRIYNDAGLMVGVGKDFLSVKTRIGFLERQNEILFNNQLYSSIVLFLAVFILTIIIMIFFMRNIILIPLKKIVEVVKMVTGGDLTKKIEIKSKDEIGQLGIAFNEMSSKLKESYSALESKIAQRTKELQDERGSLEKKVEERTSELEKLKINLEKTVEERTGTLNSKVLELEKMNDLMVGRELKMAELKKELKNLKDKKIRP